MKKSYKNKRIIIMGLGLQGGGAAAAKFFARQGARVLVTDVKSRKKLAQSLKKLKGLPITYVLGRHREEDFLKADIIVKNPAVPLSSPFLKVARSRKIPVKSDIDIFFENCPAEIAGITGTRGKSTTATLLYHLLRKKYPSVFLAGNIGVSPLEILPKLTKKSKVVLELSSFETEGLKTSPAKALVTNIFKDHLNRYGGLKEYAEAKTPIFRYQKKSDILVLNYDNIHTRKMAPKAPSRVYFFSLFRPQAGRAGKFACFLDKGGIFFNRENNKIFDAKRLKVFGEHNISNVLAAVSLAKLMGVSSEAAKEVLSKFKGVENRQEFLGEKRGVKYFNDTTSTMPEAAIAALKTLRGRFPKERIILIAGGENKNLEYKSLARQIKKFASVLILLPGTASDEIKINIGAKNRDFHIIFVPSMKKAVKTAAEKAKKGDIVVLSPAAASFNLFDNEFDRGRQFVKEVGKIK